ncbi:MAG: pseudouridine synthase [Terriglobales bacterium]
MPTTRLQKIIAAAGIASRRKAEEMIVAGRVTVNGQVVTELGTKADPERDHIRVDGKLLHGAEHYVYLLMNKPRGYVTTVSDPENRPTVMHLLRGVNARVYPVGRLDYTSEGLLLMTNDGALAYKLTHPSSHVPRTYLVKLSGKPSAEAMGKLRSGIEIGGPSAPGSLPRTTTSPTRIHLVRDATNPWYEVTLFEGRNRQIRRMFEEVGHHVEKIKRVKLGPLELDVPPGTFRKLSPEEVGMLRRAASGSLGRQPFLRSPVTPVRRTPVKREGRAGQTGIPPDRSFKKARPAGDGGGTWRHSKPYAAKDGRATRSRDRGQDVRATTGEKPARRGVGEGARRHTRAPGHRAHRSHRGKTEPAR